MNLEDILNINVVLVVDSACMANSGIMQDMESAGDHLSLSVYKNGRGVTYAVGSEKDMAHFSAHVKRLTPLPEISSDLQIEGNLDGRTSLPVLYDATGEGIYLELGGVLDRSGMPDQFYLYATYVKDASAFQGVVSLLRQKYVDCTIFGYNPKNGEVI